VLLRLFLLLPRPFLLLRPRQLKLLCLCVFLQEILGLPRPSRECCGGFF
jgi:hypothetical protein